MTSGDACPHRMWTLNVDAKNVAGTPHCMFNIKEKKNEDMTRDGHEVITPWTLQCKLVV